LKTKLAVQSEPSRQHTPILEAYHAVLRARHHMSKVTPGSMVRARECLEQAIAIDPGYALPHSVLDGSFVTPAIYGMLPAHQAIRWQRARYQKLEGGRAVFRNGNDLRPTLRRSARAVRSLSFFDWPAGGCLEGT